MGKLGEWEVEVGETPEVRPEGNGPGGVGSLGKPEEIGEVVVGNGEAWEVGETPEVRPEGNGPGGVGSLGKPEEIGEVVVGNWGAWVNWQSGKQDATFAR